MGLLFLQPYSPELNPVEHLWDELRESISTAVPSFCSTRSNFTSATPSALNQDPDRVRSITGWDWIINITLNAE